VSASCQIGSDFVSSTAVIENYDYNSLNHHMADYFINSYATEFEICRYIKAALIVLSRLLASWVGLDAALFGFTQPAKPHQPALPRMILDPLLWLQRMCVDISSVLHHELFRCC